MLEALESDLAGKTFTADALLTQTKLADFLVGRGAHFLFAVKGNRPNLLADLEFHFRKRGEPDFRERAQLRHGRIESRAIWTTATLNDYLTFPHVGSYCQIWCTEGWSCDGPAVLDDLDTVVELDPLDHFAELPEAA